MPERRISLDPDKIVTIELPAKTNHGALVKIYLEGRRKPVEIKLRDKKEAIEFIYGLWQKRESRDE